MDAGGAMANSTSNRYLSCISAFLKCCYKRGWRTAPLPELEWHKEPEHRIRWISYEEEKFLMENLREPYASLVYVAIRTGLRASELLSLEKHQVVLSPSRRRWC